MRQLLTGLVIATIALSLTSAADAKPKCVAYGREMRNLQGVTCEKAKTVATALFTTAKAPGGWYCQGQHGAVIRGYCQSVSGKRYFSWRPLN